MTIPEVVAKLPRAFSVWAEREGGEVVVFVGHVDGSCGADRAVRAGRRGRRVEGVEPIRVHLPLQTTMVSVCLAGGIHFLNPPLFSLYACKELRGR